MNILLILFYAIFKRTCAVALSKICFFLPAYGLF